MSFYKSWDFLKRWIHIEAIFHGICGRTWMMKSQNHHGLSYNSSNLPILAPVKRGLSQPWPRPNLHEPGDFLRSLEGCGKHPTISSCSKKCLELSSLAILNGLKVALCWKGGWNRPVNIFRVQIKQSIWQSEFHLALSNVLNWCKNLYQNITYRWPLTPWQAQMVLALPFPPPSCPYSGATQGNMVTIFLPLRSVREAAIQRRWNKNHSNTQASSDNFILKISQQKSCWNNKKVPD